MDHSDSSSGTLEYGSPAFFHILRNMRQEPVEIPKEVIWHDNQEGELIDWFNNLPPNEEMVSINIIFFILDNFR